MNKAAEYLKNVNMSIIEIAKLLGYDNPSNFTRTFKNVFGLLPREYKKMSKMSSFDQFE